MLFNASSSSNSGVIHSDLDQLNFSDSGLGFDLSQFLHEQQNWSFCNNNNNNNSGAGGESDYHYALGQAKTGSNDESNKLIFLNENELQAANFDVSVDCNADGGSDNLVDVDFIDFSLFEGEMLLESLGDLLNEPETEIVSPPPSNMIESVSMCSPQSSVFYSEDSEMSMAFEPCSVTDVSISRLKRGRCGSGGKVNKKESNRAAAIRYRSKKLKERDQLFVECEAYAKRNAEMKKKIDDTLTEISFIKSLLVEALVTSRK
jgi:hypothetical protein